MTIEESLADLCRYVDAGRGTQNVANLVRSWIHERIELSDGISPDLLYAITEKRIDWPGAEHFTPKSLTSFIGKLASLHPARSVLDPTCGLGLLLEEVASSSGAKLVHGVDINAECCVVAQAMFSDKAAILQGDALGSPDGLQAAYDLIVANPPFGAKVRGAPVVPYLGDAFRGDMGHALAVWACARLSESGTSMLVVTPAFLSSAHGLEAQAAIRASGCRVRALIHLPGGTFLHTGIGTYLAVFERGAQGEVFIGEFAPDKDHQTRLLANYKRGKTGESARVGRLCPLSNFRGFDAFLAQESLKRLVRTTGWPQPAAPSVILKTERLAASGASSAQGTNALCLRLLGPPFAVLDATEIRDSAARNFVRLYVDPARADARYLVHWLNHSLVGQTTLSSVSQIGALARLDLKAFLAMNLYLPPLTEQRDVLQAVEHLTRIRAEATELEAALWSCTEKADVLAHQIRTINREDRYEDWIATMPYPLASILWRHRSGSGSSRERYEVLLHFFEATAAFVATIHLSAFMADDALWKEASGGLRASLEKQHLSLERATFGAWKLTVEYLSGKCKRLLGDADGLEVCKRVYGTTNRDHIAMLCHADLLTALQRANSIRNKSLGHGGAIGDGDASNIEEELRGLVQKVRGVFGRSWQAYELIQPSTGQYKAGVHHYRANRLVGAISTPFEVVDREASQLLESDSLYLFDAVGRTGLLLRPFIRVMPSPEKRANACFIFSSREQAGARFVSYHFTEESSLTAPFPEIDEAFERIQLFDDRAKA